MITNETAKSTYTVISGKDDYAIGFLYNTNPNGSPQIKVFINKLSDTPLTYGVDYTLSDDGTKVILAEVNAGDRLDIIRDIPMVQLSDYHIGRIDPDQIEGDMDMAVMRDQQLKGDLDFAIELPEDHEARLQICEREIDALQALVPTPASPTNQLADKNFVNSSISTATAMFKGTYDTLAELEEVTADVNDYGFVVSTDAAGNTVYSRYKYNGTAWVFEYNLNNSSFTSDQWASINSGITTSLVTKLTNLPVLILSVSADGSTGVVSVTATSDITSVAVKKLYGGATVTGTSNITGATATFTPSTITDITVDDWVLEVR